MILKPPRGFISENDPRVSQVGHAAPPWLINYADLMTELCAFFIMMYAIGAAALPATHKTSKQVTETMKTAGIEGKVEVTKDGLKISLQEQKTVPFFTSGSSELQSVMKQYIDTITPALKSGISNPKSVLIVEGHTDNVPIATSQFASNWELSTARATNVVKYLVQRHGIPADKIAAIGYGEHKPLRPNDTEDNKRLNRRVVFLIKSGG
ncbi:MAG: hypothetical protein COS68_01145 [Elusimicrobia bacterium CG06_land_8_20_14_3_00_38_11]|nr:MAG: hypothetical protein COS68_01145 [Elusimicrobia bacterium CG06_land_8_20_14_3_00_38_11]